MNSLLVLRSIEKSKIDGWRDYASEFGDYGKPLAKNRIMVPLYRCRLFLCVATKYSLIYDEVPNHLIG